MFDLSGRVAVVTGGNGGIGLGMAHGLAAAGAWVAVVGRNEAKNKAAVAELGKDAFAIRADLTQPGAADSVIAQVVEQAGGMDILVNNAGTNIRKPPQDMPDEDWMAVLDANLTSTMRMCRAAHPHLKASGRGRIINNGSMLSIFGGPVHGAYAASKGAVVQYTRSLAVAWGEDGITANTVLPGWIDTELTQKSRAHDPGLQDWVTARTPLGRWGDTTSFAGIAVFLASDAAAFITGAAIPVDGGYSVRA